MKILGDRSLLDLPEILQRLVININRNWFIHILYRNTLRNLIKHKATRYIMNEYKYNSFIYFYIHDHFTDTVTLPLICDSLRTVFNFWRLDSCKTVDGVLSYIKI